LECWDVYKLQTKGKKQHDATLECIPDPSLQHDAKLGDRPSMMLARRKGKREAANNGQYKQVASIQ